MNEVINYELKTKEIGLDVYLTNSCDLRCHGCVRYSSIAKPKFYDAYSLIQDIKLMIDRDLPVGRLTMTGGEPTLHKDLKLIISEIRAMKSDMLLSIFTNGKKLINMINHEDYSMLEFFSKNKVCINYSNYPALDYSKLISVSKKLNVLIENISDVNASTAPETQEYFYLNKLSHISNRPLMTKYYTCHDTCPCLWDSKIFLCGRCALIDTLNEYIENKFIKSEDDFIRVSELISLPQYFRYITRPISFCKYCFNVDSEIIKWSLNPTSIKDYVHE
jgi:organic radical activating enzyme